MNFSNACRFFLFSCLSLSVNADTVRGAHRELDDPIQPVVNLGPAGDYVILAKSGISSIAPSVVTGDIAVSPIAATAMTGFLLTLDSAGQSATSEQIEGFAYAASYGGATATALTAAVGAMGTAYTDAAGRPNENALRKNIGSGALGGDGENGLNGGAEEPLTAGVYTFGSDVTINEDIYFQGTNPGNNDDPDIFIIQMGGNLKQVANTTVSLTDGALAENIFWQVAGNVEVQIGAEMKGILLVKTDVLFKTGSSLNGGRVLSQTACNLQEATITQPE
jgi:hypothetical protein